MPKIQPLSPQTRLRGSGFVPQVRVRSNAEAFQAVGTAFDQMADVLGQRQREEDQLETVSHLLDARLEAERRLSEIGPELSEDPSQTAARSRQIFDDVQREFSERVPNSSRNFFESRWLGFQMDMIPDLQREAMRTQLNKRVERVDRAISTAGNAVSTDPALRDQVEVEVTGLLEASGLTADSLAKKKAELSSVLAQAELAPLIAEDPENARARLLGGEWDKDLPFEKKQQLLAQADREAEQAQRDRISAAEAAERRAERRRKRAQEEAYENLATQAFDDANPLADDTIEAAQRDRQITAAQATKLKQIRRTEAEGETDPIVMLDFLEREHEGTLTVDRVIDAADGGHLSREDANAFMGRLRQADRQGGILAREDVRVSRQRVKEIVGGQSGPAARFAGPDVERIVNADRAFLRLVTEEKLPPLEAERRVIEFYRSQPALLPKPMFGARPARPEDVARIAAETLRARRANVITEREMEEQTELLERWKETFNQ